MFHITVDSEGYIINPTKVQFVHLFQKCSYVKITRLENIRMVMLIFTYLLLLLGNVMYMSNLLKFLQLELLENYCIKGASLVLSSF